MTKKKTKTINHDNKINELIAPGVAFAMTVNAQNYWIGIEFFLMSSCMWASQGVHLETD